jgi:hypothetical protein
MKKGGWYKVSTSYTLGDWVIVELYDGNSKTQLKIEGKDAEAICGELLGFLNGEYTCSEDKSKSA